MVNDVFDDCRLKNLRKHVSFCQSSGIIWT